MPTQESYAEFPPPPSLAPWVKVVWTYTAPNPSTTIQRIAPDGCPELILDIGAPYEEAGDDGVFRLQPKALFADQMTRPLALRPVGPVELVAVRFEPDGLVFQSHAWIDAWWRTATRRDDRDLVIGLVWNGVSTSPITGPKGNVEFTAYWSKPV